ncbi:MAG: type II toxin-antitoxin system HicB family antitoxin [Candidatus Heimdallarchaeaceae archaeon]
MRTFTMIIEKDKQGVHIGSIVELPGLQAKGKNTTELKRNIRDAIIVYAAFHHNYEAKELEFVGLHRIKVPLKELDEASQSTNEEYMDF